MNIPIKTKQLSISKEHVFSHDNILEHMTNYLCSSLVKNLSAEVAQKISFSEVNNEEQLKKVMDLRLKAYSKSNQYMLRELESGMDTFEPRSCIYVVWCDEIAVATIRLTPYPFETLKFVSEESLLQFLGHDFKEHYLEWSRLVVDPDIRNPRIVPALIVYAGMKVLTNSPYTKYFGFTKPQVRRLLQKFNLSSDTIEFSIPSRENNLYFLSKGCFLNDFMGLINKNFSFFG